MSDFVHLHLHTQYSILDGASNIKKLIKQASELNMKALAITDHGNMFGVKTFHKEAVEKGIKPIIGCECYVAKDTRLSKDGKDDGGGAHLVVLAKNKKGYENLTRIVSYAWTEGFYYKPRIDKELLEKYHEGLIVSTACLGGEIPKLLRNNRYEEAEKQIAWFKSLFKEDFYLEVQLHKSGDPKIDSEVYEQQKLVNDFLYELGEKHQIPVIATNDVHFIAEEDAEAHDSLLCISTGTYVDAEDRMRYTRQEFLKSADQMAAMFSDHPEIIANTVVLAEKIEVYEIENPPIMPSFHIPEDFATLETIKEKYSEEKIIAYFGEKRLEEIGGYEKSIDIMLEGDYLRHLVYEGAKKRWGDTLLQETTDRLDFELDTIIKMGFPGYFLIVWDFLKAAREMGVSVGPGRGSAAGSAVAYSLWITDMDPLKYLLLFERFLNPDRVSMPDIDIDFDEEGREKILQWVVDKYGKNRVAHIVTFGKMAPKMAIKDVARVQQLPLAEANRLAKLVPEKPGTNFKTAFEESPELKKEKEKGTPEVRKCLLLAEKLEGSVRQTGVHACGIIIGKNDLEEHVPLCTQKDVQYNVTQYDGSQVEEIGLLKMDFLGLKTLSIIKDAVDIIKQTRGKEIDINAIPLDDEETYKTYANGDTVALFQFESQGMQKHLKELKPNRFEDLIAMNALYRPGPMDYIPSFIRRKHGKEKIEYDLPEMEELLQDTYGVTVYQEQVMLLSQKLAGFTKGQADSLRKAMGKKIRAMMDPLKEQFMEGGEKNGFSIAKLEKIWKDWEAFAQYAFNKSHSTCYAYISYQTGFLKTHYPAAFMAAVLSRNINNLDKLTFFMDECRRMGIQILGPDVNESVSLFTVNKDGNIRYGIGGIKGVGEAAVQKIVEEREANGAYQDLFDFIERVHLQTVNRKTIESLALSGAFDNFEEVQRECFFSEDDKGNSFTEHLIRYGSKVQSEKETPTLTLFGENNNETGIIRPDFPKVEPWNLISKLNKEKELAGMYISAHPLDEYKFEINAFVNTRLKEVKDIERVKGKKEISIAGIITDVIENRLTKNGKPWGGVTLEDYTSSFSFRLFGDEYIKFKNYFVKGYAVLIKGAYERPRWAKEGDDRIDFKAKSIELLSNITEKNIQSIDLQIDVLHVDERKVEEIMGLTDTNQQGKSLLKITLVDAKENLAVKMFSRTRKVTLDEKFKDFLKKNPEIKYQVN